MTIECLQRLIFPAPPSRMAPLHRSEDGMDRLPRRDQRGKDSIENEHSAHFTHAATQRMLGVGVSGGWNAMKRAAEPPKRATLDRRLPD